MTTKTKPTKKVDRRNYNFAISAIIATVVAVVLLGVIFFQCARISDLRSQIADLELINSQLESGYDHTGEDVYNDILENGIYYQGQNGRTALEILRENFNIETTDYMGIGEFVTSIEGITAGGTHFWAFYVNGEMAMVGAGEFETRDEDRIEWKFKEIQF